MIKTKTFGIRSNYGRLLTLLTVITPQKVPNSHPEHFACHLEPRAVILSPAGVGMDSAKDLGSSNLWS